MYARNSLLHPLMRRVRDGAGGSRLSVFACAWIVVLLACAVSVPPGGGPEDKVPPTVAVTVPRADSTGVDPQSPIRIVFSEPMKRERVERMVVVNPPIEIERVKWDGNAIIIGPAGGLVRDTTYVVRLKPDYQDHHSVSATQWHQFAFATGTAALDTARIEGKVLLKHAPAGKAIVRCFRVTVNDTLDVLKSKPNRETAANRDGDFSLQYLPSNDARFVVMAFQDANSNRIYDPDGDPAKVYADTVVIVPAMPVISGIEMVLIDPRDPGSVSGTVVNESGADSASVMVAMYDTADSTRAAYRTVCDSTGAYEIANVKPSGYIVRAFVDVKPDSLPGVYPCPDRPEGCREPGVRQPGVLKVSPAAVIKNPPLVIRREEQP